MRRFGFEHWSEDLVQGRKRELGFGLDTDRMQDQHSVCAGGCMLKQRRLADPRLPTQDEHPACARPSVIEKTVDRLGLRAPSDEHRASDSNAGRTGALDWRSP